MGHYVYIYRDHKGKARYVGYGEKVSRPTSHLSGSHNQALTSFLQADQYHLEIAGPFDDKEMALAVETALISAMQPDCNLDPGQERWRFRPLGVPEKFANRLTLAPLTQRDLCSAETGAQSVMLVKIGDKDFEDGREVYDPANPPCDEAILERFDKWWQVGRFVETWALNPALGPRLLLGVTGKPGRQVIIGSVFIAQGQWRQARRNGALVEIPTCGPRNLDAQQLRGRRIDAATGIRFGAWKHQFFKLLAPENP